ncbi:MAG: beta-glucosidase family protein [Vulcanimicrobiaceae bacterium]
MLKLVVTHYPGLTKVPSGPWEHKNGAAWSDPVPTLGFNGFLPTDGSVGVGDPADESEEAQATAFPSLISSASSWNPDLLRQLGTIVAREARAKGFNVLLSGGINLIRDPRGGRNFEYLGEDPLLVGTLAAAYVNGAQSQHVVATLKHFALNNYETGRTQYDVSIDRRAAMESDLLAFDLAIHSSQPGSIMCAYNAVKGDYACESDYLLTQVLRKQWHYQGWVMSDWGATHSTIKAANSGLDQESAEEADVAVGLGATAMIGGDSPTAPVMSRINLATQSGAISSNAFFADPLVKALANGQVSQARLREMTRRILYSLYANGVIDNPPELRPIDKMADERAAEQASEQGIVLLKNEGNILPMGRTVPSIAVIGSHEDKGVLSGGGSAAVLPFGGNAVPGAGKLNIALTPVWDPSSPVSELKKLASNPGSISFTDGSALRAAVNAARNADRVVLFAHQWSHEGKDLANLTLPDDQDALIAAVAHANPNMIVVLETMGPVTMPWLRDVKAVVEAWYPGSGGGEAIAKTLFGLVNPSGRLPQTFPLSESDLPRPELPLAPPFGDEGRPALFKLAYDEGANVGYKWFDVQKRPVLFPFGFGLSYTAFKYARMSSLQNGKLAFQVDVENTGGRAGIDTVQVYVDSVDIAGQSIPKHLVGWSKAALAAGEQKRVTIEINPKMLATYDPATSDWRVHRGTYTFRLGFSSRNLALSTNVFVGEEILP